jgi:hypothetical protein
MDATENQKPHDGIRLVMRSDDFGMTHASNVAVENAFLHGVQTCAGIIPPAPWAEEAARLAAGHPSWCVGIHLAVIGEWTGYRWRPVLSSDRVRSLVDENGFFPQTPRVFETRKPDPREVEAELRAQVRLVADVWGVRVEYLDSHCTGGPGWEWYDEIVRAIARDRGIPVTLEAGDALAPGDGIYSIAPAYKEKRLLELIKQLSPGTWTMIFHPLAEAPDSHVLVHAEPNPVAREGVGHHRVAELQCLLSPRVKRLIAKKGIRLISYRDLQEVIRPGPGEGGVQPLFAAPPTPRR